MAATQSFYDRLMGVRPLAQLEPYFEAGQNGRVYTEVNLALSGENGSSVRVNELDKLVLSVAVPIRRFATLYGVLMLTTESGDIDDILKDERAALVKVFALAFGVLLLSSLYLAGTIAAPVRRLAAAAERVRRGRAGRELIPEIPDRGDEIGELAESLSAMTRALYDRIDAIERFAADVAHELKNPITSLRSAVEMLERTKDSDNRERLVQVIRNDLKRIDRLITDISDASRLDAELSRGHSQPVDVGRLAANAGHYLCRDGHAARRPCRGRARLGKGRDRSGYGRAIGPGVPQSDRQRDFVQPRWRACARCGTFERRCGARGRRG